MELSEPTPSAVAITRNLYRQDLNHIHLCSGAQICYYIDDILLWGGSFDIVIQDIQTLIKELTKRNGPLSHT